MRILAIAEVFHPETIGGAGRVAAENARRLAKRGHEVTVITRRTEGYATEEVREGVRILRFPCDLSSPWRAWRTTRRGIIDLGRREGPDIVSIHQPHAGFHYLNLRTGVPLVCEFYSSWPEEFRVKRRGAYGRDRLVIAGMKAIERRVLSAARKIVVLSEQSMREVRQYYPQLADRTVRIPGGVDTQGFPIKNESEHAGRFVLLTVRNLVPRMGIENLLDALAEIRSDFPDVVLRIAGEGPLRGELQERASRLGLADICSFLGRVPESDLAALYRSADLFVLPTFALEGFGLVMLEAMASGTPIVGTPVGSIPEIATLQGNEFVFEGSDARSIARGLTKLIQDRERLAAMRLTIRTIAEEFDWEKRVSRIEKLYESVGRSGKGI